MKIVRKVGSFLFISVFLLSCTPQELIQEESNITNQDIFATGDGDHSSTDNDRDGGS